MRSITSARLEESFQSPSCRGEERSCNSPLGLIPKKSGFNPLLVGARSAPERIPTPRFIITRFQSPSCRGEERSSWENWPFVANSLEYTFCAPQKATLLFRLGAGSAGRENDW